ncbi:helix-turn-helix transcriptional regulator [Ferrovibrio sp.]|uniref:helix-turn-helix domain-containing protein n=1 Tax=Ferrovibrio sp. TaxID=1917215 RepID=UPI0025B94ED9|nr:helix-turn-helix transcriptional regulator [Ferrovibrio sp.]MBX3455707.1 helix-turn-helix transcriptional regulator [Ferrovibrio sp.]
MKRKRSDFPHPMDIQVGRRLRAARLLSGFSQSVLGKHVDLTFQQIQKYEKGLNRIGASRLQQFAQLLNVPPSYFFEGGLENETPAALPVDGVADQTSAELYAGGAPSISDNAAMPSPNRQTVDLVYHFNRITDPALRASLVHLVKTAASATEAASLPKQGNSKG